MPASSLRARMANFFGSVALSAARKLGAETSCASPTKQSELENLRRRNRFLESIIDHVPAPLVVRDINSERCVLANPRRRNFPTSIARRSWKGPWINSIHRSAPNESVTTIGK